MVKAKEVKLVMNQGESAIRFEKRWIARHRLVQQIDCLSPIRRAGARCYLIVGARIELEGDQIGGWLALNGQFLRRCDFGVEPLCDLFCNLALDREQVIQIAIVLLGKTCVSVRVSIN